jgi:RNA polymerase sigma factor (sigma-70 family)
MPNDGSISRWIGGLKTGEAEAAQRIWERYSEQLLTVARRKLGGIHRSVVDEDDVAQNVFSTICRGAADGRFKEVKNRDELWWLLVAITRQKVADHVRREGALKRGAGRVHVESQIPGTDGERSAFDQIMGNSPTPDFLTMLNEEFQRLLGLLRDDCLREIVIMRLEGFTVSEIATKLGIGQRAVERKLQLIRAKFTKEFSKSE